jgi:hypothetical protein
MCVEYRAGKVCCQRGLNSALLGEQEQLTRGLFRFHDHLLDWFRVLPLASRSKYSQNLPRGCDRTAEHQPGEYRTFVTRNSIDFRGPSDAPGSKGQYADVAVHAGLICLNRSSRNGS